MQKADALCRQVVDAFDPNSSAAEADLRQGDILSRVDGVDVIGMPVPTVAEKIFGPVGSPVSLDSSKIFWPSRAACTQRQHEFDTTRCVPFCERTGSK